MWPIHIGKRASSFPACCNVSKKELLTSLVISFSLSISLLAVSQLHRKRKQNVLSSIVPLGLVEAMDDVWAEHVQEIDDIIGEWETDEEGPSLEEFIDWIDTSNFEAPPDPVPEMKEHRLVF